MEELKLVEHFMLLCRIQQNADQIGGMMPGFPLHLAFEQYVYKFVFKGFKNMQLEWFKWQIMPLKKM